MDLKKQYTDRNEQKFEYFKIENKLNYVAIGDDFSGGFNSKFGFLNLGNFDKANNKVSGLSYPAFFARMINDVKPNYLDSFYNFSFPNIRIKQFNELLQDNELSNETKKILNFAQIVDKEEINPFKHEYSKYFEDFSTEKLNIIKEKVTQANLVTVNLGLHDLINFFPIIEIKSLFKHKTVNEFNECLQNLHNSLKIRAAKITKYIETLVYSIRKLNSTTNIVIMSYTKPLIHFETIIDELLLKNNENANTILEIFVFYLNRALKDAANNSKCFYIDINDSEFLLKHKEFLYESYFDIHPTEKTYKFIAQQLILKLALDNKFIYHSYADNDKKILRYLSSLAHYKKDFLSYRKVLYLNENDIVVIIKVLGLNRTDKLFLNDEFEKENYNILKSNNQISWYISHLESDLNLNIKKIMIKTIETKFYSPEYSYKTKDYLLNYLQDKKWAQQIILHILNGDAFNNFLIALQNKVKKTRKYNSQISLANLRDAKNEVLKNQKVIYAIIKNLFSASFILESKQELKEINYMFLTELLTTPLLETLVNHKLSKRHSYLRNYLAKLEIFKEFADFLFMNFTINLKNYSELNIFDEAWAKWLVLNHYKIIYYFDKIIKEISLKENKDQTIEFVKLSILLIYKIPQNKDLNTKKLEDKIENLIWLANEHKDILNKYLSILIKEFQSFSIYDYVFQNIKKKTKNAFKLRLFKKIRYANVLKKFVIVILGIKIEIKNIKKFLKKQSENK